MNCVFCEEHGTFILALLLVLGVPCVAVACFLLVDIFRLTLKDFFELLKK